MLTAGGAENYVLSKQFEAGAPLHALFSGISDLVKTFTSLGLRDVIIKRYGSVGFDISRIDCDYYYYREGSPAAVNAFRGEYMSQYSWAEETLGRLVFSGD